jgi:bacillithiol system protein YtxJ
VDAGAVKIKPGSINGEENMPGILNELKSVEDLNRVLDESSAHPVLLFKHSLTCPISGRAYREFQSYLEDAEPQVSYHLITVQTARSVSNEAASRLGVEHHSPQAILVKDGREVWNASHFDITANSLAAVIHSNLS